MKKQTHLHLGWPDGVHFQQIFIFGWVPGTEGSGTRWRTCCVWLGVWHCRHAYVRYEFKAGSKCFKAPPTRCKLPVMRTCMFTASRSGAAFPFMLGLTGMPHLFGSDRTESLPWLIHCRALRMQGNTSVSLCLSAINGKPPPIRSSASGFSPWPFRTRQLCWLSRQRVSMFSTETLKFCWSEGQSVLLKCRMQKK